MIARLPSLISSTLIAVAFAVASASAGRADMLAEFLFWDEMGHVTADAVRNYNDYERERQLWRDNIAAARAELERCGGCAEAQAELEKWQGVENQFQDFAGAVFAAVGMPRIVADALDIRMPLVQGSPEDLASQCEIVRPEWVSQRSGLCQTKVDEYLTCLRDYEQQYGICSSDVAMTPGGVCWWKSKFYEPCYQENYTAVDLEQRVQDARAGGAIIPDYARRGAVATVAYGAVPEGFQPPLPPPELASRIIDVEYYLTQEIKYLMESPPGSLRQAAIRRFNWADVAPDSRCYEGIDITDEFEQRVCEDLSEVGTLHYPLILACFYAGGNEGHVADALFWYGEPPEAPVFDPAHLLERAHDHPLLALMETSTECPATLEAARGKSAEYRMRLASLGVDEVSADVAMRSGWRAELDLIWAEQQRRDQEGLAALPDFRFTGQYDFELAGAWGAATGKCTITRDANPERTGDFFVTCLDDNGSLYVQRAHYEAVGRLPSFHVEWNLVGEYEDIFDYEISPPWNALTFYRVDVAARELDDGDILETSSVPNLMRGGRLARVGDIETPDGTALEVLVPLRGALAQFARERKIDSLEELASYSNDHIDDFDTYSNAPQGPGANWRERRDWAREFLRGKLAGLTAEEALARLTLPTLSAPAEPAPSVLTGTWSGSYQCGIPHIGLELTLEETDSGGVWGTFAFSALPDGTDIPNGSFYVWGLRHKDAGTIELNAGPWIEQPSGWEPVGLTGKYVPSEDGGGAAADRIVGQIVHSRCYDFEVTRKDGDISALGDLPDAIENSLAALGRGQ